VKLFQASSLSAPALIYIFHRELKLVKLFQASSLSAPALIYIFHRELKLVLG